MITERFCQVDHRLKGAPKHPQAWRWPSEGVTLARWHALKGVGNRAFSRWRVRDYRARFPPRPERTRRVRLFKTHWHWSYALMAEGTLVGVADPSGLERRPPLRQGRRAAPLGRKGLSPPRWVVGIKLGVRLHRWGWVVGWVWAPAPLPEVHFPPLVAAVEERRRVVADRRFHAAAGEPAPRHGGRRGEGNDRRVVETVLSMLTPLSPLNQVGHRVAESVPARLAFTMAVFNRLAPWYRLPADEDNFVPLSIAEFSL